MSWKYFAIPIFCFITLICSEPCPPPDVPFNGTYFPKQNTFLPGDQVVYTCDNGYVRYGKEVRTCKSNGYWSDQTPFCDVVVRLFIQEDNLFDLNFRHVIDKNTSTCIQWDPKKIQRLIVDPNFSQESDIRFFRLRILIESGKAELRLSPGKGNDTGQCDSINKRRVRPSWDSSVCRFGYAFKDTIMITNAVNSDIISICEIEIYLPNYENCDHPPDIRVPNGLFRINRLIAVLKCEDGFNPVNDTILCSNSVWSGHGPRCDEILCHPHEYNSTLDPGTEWMVLDSVRKLSPGTRRRLNCRPGYQRVGEPEEVTCLGNGRWHKTNATCIEKLCEPHVHNSTLDPGTEWIFLDSVRKLLPGTRRQLKCSSGYHKVGSPEEVTCHKNGTWTKTNATCIETLCQPYAHSSTLDPGTEWIFSDSITKLSPGARMMLKCSPTYQKIGGPEEIICLMNGTWTETNATCIEILCQPHIHNSTLDPGTEWIFLDSVQKLSPGTRRQLKCSSGYQKVGGPEEVTCQRNGTWTKTNATCIEVSAKTKKHLLQYLFEDQGYDKRFRPVKNQKTVVPVTVDLTPLEVKYKMQHNFPWKLDTWVSVKWKDEYLTWSPKDFGNIEQLILPASNVWIPDLSLYHNNLDSSFLSDVTTNVIVRFDGELKWVTLNSVLIQFDEKSNNCTISIKARTYDVSLMKVNAEHQVNKSLTHFKNHSWKLKSIDVSEELGNFSWSEQPFSIILFNLKFEKR